MSISIIYPYTTPTTNNGWQSTLIYDSVLGQNNNVDGNNYTFEWHNTQFFFSTQAIGSGTGVELYMNGNFQWILGSVIANGTLITGEQYSMHTEYRDVTTTIVRGGLDFSFLSTEFFYGFDYIGGENKTGYYVNATNKVLKTFVNDAEIGFKVDDVAEKVYLGRFPTGIVAKGFQYNRSEEHTSEL